MTREEKLRRIALLKEKKRRARFPKYVPNPSQLLVHQSPKRSRFCFSGNGMGKTTLAIQELIWTVTGHNPITNTKYKSNQRVFIVLDRPEKIENVFLPELKKWYDLKPEQLHKRGKPYYSEITFPETNSWVKFMFHDQNPLTAEGLEMDLAIYDEPCPRKLFIALFRGGRTKGRTGRHLFIGTPLAAPWLRTDIYEKWSKGELADVDCFRGETADNLDNLDQEWYKGFVGMLSDKEKEIRLKGHFFDLEGLALAHLFKRTTHTITKEQLNWDKQYPCVIAMDPHPSKKHHAVLLGIDKDNYMYVLDEFASKSIARQFINQIIDRGWLHQYRVLDIVYDSLGNGETTSGEGFLPFGTVINEELKKKGLCRARATTYDDKSDEAFISRIQDAITMPEKPNNFGQQIPKLRIVNTCTGTIGDIENAQWMVDKKLELTKPKLDIRNLDYLACLKYALATNLYYKKTKDKAYYVNRPIYGLETKSQKYVKMKRNNFNRQWRNYKG